VVAGEASLRKEESPLVEEGPQTGERCGKALPLLLYDHTWLCDPGAKPWGLRVEQRGASRNSNSGVIVTEALVADEVPSGVVGMMVPRGDERDRGGRQELQSYHGPRPEPPEANHRPIHGRSPRCWPSCMRTGSCSAARARFTKRRESLASPGACSAEQDAVGGGYLTSSSRQVICIPQ